MINFVPNNNIHRSWKKNLCIIELGDREDIHEAILEAFPKLDQAGGYELLRLDQGKNLEVILPPPEGYSVGYLKDVLQQAKVYIRPLQKDLSMDPIPSTLVRHCRILHHHLKIYIMCPRTFINHPCYLIVWPKREVPELSCGIPTNRFEETYGQLQEASFCIIIEWVQHLNQVA